MLKRGRTYPPGRYWIGDSVNVGMSRMAEHTEYEPWEMVKGDGFMGESQLYDFRGRMSQHCVSADTMSIIPAEAITDMDGEHLGFWITAKGGLKLKYLKEPDSMCLEPEVICELTMLNAPATNQPIESESYTVCRIPHNPEPC